MCGLVGVLRKGGTNSNDIAAFKTLLLFDTLRGKDSTGVAWRHEGKDFIYKKAISGIDMVASYDFDKFLPKDSVYLMGHNRAATVGKVNKENAHPFQHGNIILAHNGTLRSTRSLPKQFDVDSEAICYSINKVGIKETVKNLDGAYALSFINRKDNTFNLIRNDERPLFVGTTKDAVFYSSDKHILALAVYHAAVGDVQIKEFPTDTLYSIDLNSFEVERETIRKHYVHSYNSHYNSNIYDSVNVKEICLWEYIPYNNNSLYGEYRGFVCTSNGVATTQEVVVSGVKKDSLDMDALYSARLSSYASNGKTYATIISKKEEKKEDVKNKEVAREEKKVIPIGKQVITYASCEWCTGYFNKQSMSLYENILICKECKSTVMDITLL